jgi:hypothetical protein
MNARTKLKEAGAAIGKLNAEIEQLEESLTRSKRIAAEAEESHAGFDKLDSAVTRFRSEAVKDGRDPRQLPAELKKQQAGRKEAADELEMAQGTVELISKELEDAKGRLQRLQPGLAPAAAEVLAEEYADELGRELVAIEKRRWELRNVLTGFALLQHFDPQKGYVTLGHSSIVAAAFAGYSPGQYSVMSRPDEDMATRWHTQLVALLNDADASVGGIEPILPSHYWGK